MKWLCFILVFLAVPVFGQDHIFLDFDSIPNCAIIKEGTFLNIDQSRSAYYMGIHRPAPDPIPMATQKKTVEWTLGPAPSPRTTSR